MANPGSIPNTSEPHKECSLSTESGVNPENFWLLHHPPKKEKEEKEELPGAGDQENESYEPLDRTSSIQLECNVKSALIVQ